MAFGKAGRPPKVDVTTVVMWNEPEGEREPNLDSIEEQVELRRTGKKLSDYYYGIADLPPGFKLSHPQPKQYWDKLVCTLMWGFELQWDGGSQNQTLSGKVVSMGGNSRWKFFSRYDPRIKDAVQMEWALMDFSNELVAAGYDLRTGQKTEQQVA